MVAILFLIGHGLEKPEIIDHMLDIEKCPCKPQYGMASGENMWPLRACTQKRIRFSEHS